jgi:hypothetical protein
MPVILPRDKEDIWINPTTEDKVTLVGILKHFPSEEMEAYEVILPLQHHISDFSILKSIFLFMESGEDSEEQD